MHSASTANVASGSVTIKDGKDGEKYIELGTTRRASVKMFNGGR